MQAKGDVTFNVEIRDKKTKEVTGTKDITLTGDFIALTTYEKKVMEEKYVPHVIEPSYGLGRIMYCVMEHCFRMRAEDQMRTYFDFPA
jgi:glycyl-tRNA synthetase